jgi:uncharacterized transporter YbjL
MRSATVFTRRASPLTCSTSPLFSTTLSSIGISIWLREVFDRDLLDMRIVTEEIVVKNHNAVGRRLAQLKPEARVEASVRVRVAHQRNIVAHLQHRVAVRVGQNLPQR